MARTSKLMRPFLDEADGSLHELAARTLHQARCHHDVSSCDVVFQGDRAPHSSKAHHPVMFVKGLCFCYLVLCFTCKAKVMTIRTVWKDLMEPLKARSFLTMLRDCPAYVSRRRRSTNRSSGITLCRISSENLVLVSAG